MTGTRTGPPLALLLLAACAPVEGDDDFVSDAPPARVVGEPESCITTTAIRNSRVRDDRTIDFEMAGGRVYRNTLGSRCPRLGFEKGFTYRVSTSRLCNVDIIYVLDTTAGGVERGAGCGLGEFVPIEYLDEDEIGDDS